MKPLATLLFLISAAPVFAGSIFPAAPIRAGTVIEAVHLTVSDVNVPGALDDMRDIIGLEARVTLYPNRPLRAEDLGAPTLVQRNTRVQLLYRSGGLRISVEGRALSRGGAGEIVRAMNLASRTTVTGVAVGPNQVEVSQ